MDKNLGNQPAFPFTYNEGMTLRQYYAGMAPDKIPGWFRHTVENVPIKPKYYTELNLDKDGDDYKTIQNWHRDSCFDLPEHLFWYQESWQKYHEISAEWKIKDEEQKYFQWRVYYSNALISELNKNDQNE